MTKKKGELQRALKGHLTSAQRFVLGELLKLLDELSAAVERVNEQLRQQVEKNAEQFVSEAVTLLETIPGIGRRIADLAAQFKRLVRVKGKKRALVAVGHSIIVIAYHLLKQHKSYEDLGGDYFDRQNVEMQRSRLMNKLEALGLKVTAEVKESAA